MTKKVLMEMIKEVRSEQKSMLLEKPTVDEMATGRSVADRIDPNARPERTAKEFVVMSSDRGERSDEENLQLYNEFRKTLEAKGLQYTEFIGSWEETDEETDEKRRVTENSAIIYKDPRPDMEQAGEGLFDVAMDLSKKYNQEAFIYGELVQSRGGLTRVIKAFDAQGVVQDWGGPWSTAEEVKQDDLFWSRVRGSGKGAPFQFKEHQEYVEIEAPNSVIEAMRKASKHQGKKIKFVRRKNA